MTLHIEHKYKIFGTKYRLDGAEVEKAIREYLERHLKKTIPYKALVFDDPPEEVVVSLQAMEISPMPPGWAKEGGDGG